jgi:hypothetical protein
MIIQFPRKHHVKVRGLIERIDNLTISLKNVKSFFVIYSTEEELLKCLNNCTEMKDCLIGGEFSDNDFAVYDAYVNGMQNTVDSMTVHMKHFY